MSRRREARGVRGGRPSGEQRGEPLVEPLVAVSVIGLVLAMTAVIAPVVCAPGPRGQRGLRRTPSKGAASLVSHLTGMVTPENAVLRRPTPLR